MSKIVQMWVAIFVTIVVAVLAIIGVLKLGGRGSSGDLFATEEVREVSVWVKNREYPLSFEQKNRFLALLSLGRAVAKEEMPDWGDKPEIDGVMINRFNPPDIRMRVLGVIDGNVVFAVPHMPPQFSKGFYLDQSDGQMLLLLQEVGE